MHRSERGGIAELSFIRDTPSNPATHSTDSVRQSTYGSGPVYARWLRPCPSVATAERSPGATGQRRILRLHVNCGIDSGPHHGGFTAHEVLAPAWGALWHPTCREQLGCPTGNPFRSRAQQFRGLVAPHRARIEVRWPVLTLGRETRRWRDGIRGFAPHESSRIPRRGHSITARSAAFPEPTRDLAILVGEQGIRHFKTQPLVQANVFTYLLDIGMRIEQPHK